MSGAPTPSFQPVTPDVPSLIAAPIHMPLPPADLVERLARSPFDIESVEGAGGGVTGAKKLSLTFRNDGLSLDVKWKKAPAGGDGWNNSPRREVGVYEAQKLFLDPHDYVIPPIVVRSIDPTEYRSVGGDLSPNLDGTTGIYGALAVWLKNAIQPDRAFDPARFAADSRYAYHFGNLNLLHYIVDHRDARGSNFLISTDPGNPQVFSIDNGIAFGRTLYNFFTWHFDKIRVDTLPQQSIDRLRRVTLDDLERLAILAELRVDQAGMLRAAAPGANLDRTAGNRVHPGVVQIGLTVVEIDAMTRRIATLLNRVDRGELQTA